MISIRIKRATATVRHPEITGLAVVFEQAPRVDAFAWPAVLEEYTKTFPAMNQLTGEPLYDKAGNLLTVKSNPVVPVERVVDYVEPKVVSIVGVKEADEASKREILLAFLEPPFDCHNILKTVEEVQDGRKVQVQRNIDQAFLFYLLDRLHEEGTFKHPDPLAETSS